MPDNLDLGRSRRTDMSAGQSIMDFARVCNLQLYQNTFCVRLHGCAASQRSDCESQAKWRCADCLEKPQVQTKPDLKM